MLLKNTSARLIAINTANGDTFMCLPGNHPPTKVSDEAMKLDFTKDCIKRGWLVKVAEEESDEDDDQPTEKEGLKSDLEALGVEVGSKWTIAKMKEELEKAMG